MNPPSRRFQRIAPWLFGFAIAIAVVTLIVINQLNVSARTARIAAPGAHIVVPFTGFGGYNWTGKVTNISAQWRVPAIATDSPTGSGATWIGVQNNVNNQFVQIGVEENDFGDEPNQYKAFWSDLQVGFSPQSFGDVYPGDTISVSMSRTGKGWSLRLADLSRNLKGTAFAALSKSVPFTQGEWIQEDPTASTNTSQDLPYPQMSDVTFRDLKVNDRTPILNTDDGQVLMAWGGTIQVPSRVINDAFSLSSPTGAARQYLDSEQYLDTALDQFAVQLASWNSASGTKESSVARSMTKAMTTDSRGLSRHQWPIASRSAVTQIIRSDRIQLKNLASWSRDNFNTRSSAFQSFQIELNRNEQLVNVLRKLLGIPPL